MGAERTMGWRQQGRLSITYHTERSPSDDEWRRYLAHIRASGPLEGRRVVVVSLGGGPDGRQRKALQEIFLGSARARTAIVTSNRLMQAIGAAVAFFNRSLRVFGKEEMDAAFRYLELTPEESRRCRDLVDEVARDLASDTGS